MSNTVEVITKQGTILGNLMQDGSRNFKGIPYASPPVGELRLKRSIPPRGGPIAGLYGVSCLLVTKSRPTLSASAAYLEGYPKTVCT